MTWVAWLWIALSLLAALVFSVLVWFAGPVIFIGDAQPFEGVFVRVTIILIVWLIIGGAIVWRVVKRRRAAAALEKAMTEAAVDDSDAPILKERMEDALDTLRRTSKSTTGALYDLPWYLIIGPPGAGKTTALINSGLKFPLAGDTAARAIKGVGGTRYCDWWFTDEAVLIDTAGRYTTQDSDAKVDRKSWLFFLDVLKTTRPRQPINGVIVAISITDVMNLSSAELGAHAAAIRKRLNELHEVLKISFPVYVIFTKMDLLVGFNQYFADLDENKRRSVWGATFQTGDKKANHVGKVPEETDLLIQRIFERMPERLQDEPDLRARALLFGLPAQLNAIRAPVAELLNSVFEPTRYQTAATLRGFYFTSGTQEGTPFDAVIGALQRSFGVESLAAAAYSGMGRSYFQYDLFTKVIFGEAGWVSTNLAAVRRSFVLRAAAFTVVAIATVGILGLWQISYRRNAELIAATQSGVDAYAASAAPLIQQTSVTSPDLQAVYEVINALPELPAGYAHRHESAPVAATFGLNERPRVLSASELIYQQSLERLLRPRLVLGLEQQIQKSINDPAFVYEALKVYLMLGGSAPKIDKELIVNWFERDWAEQMPGAPNEAQRTLLRGHLRAMLDLDVNETPKVSLNGPLVKQAQATLSRMRVSERAYTLLKAAARNEAIEDWVATQRGGPDMGLVFEAAEGASLDTIHVPGFFTYRGFYVGLLDHMTTIRDNLEKENWVLGDSGEQNAVKQQYDSLLPDILEQYGREFIAAWSVINNLRLRPLLGDKPRYITLSAASAPTSPIRLIFESIRDETALTRERKKIAEPAATDQLTKDAEKAAQERMGAISREAFKLAKSQRRAGDSPVEVPGAAIEAYFKPIQILVDGDPGTRPIDHLLANLQELDTQLTLAATNPAIAPSALAQVDVQVASLRSNVTRLPPPLMEMVDKVAHDAARSVASSNVAELSEALTQEVTAPCLQIVGKFYPFSPKSDRDVPMADFARLFAPNGVIDRFFSTRVAPLVNIGTTNWSWAPNPNLNRKLSDATLRHFKEARDIRDAFFPTGGAFPNVSLEVKLLSLSSLATTATLTVNGSAIAFQSGAPPAPIVPPPASTPASSTPTPAPSPTPPPGPPPLPPHGAATLQWPGAGAGAASITLAPELPDGPSHRSVNGAWALFRLIDKSSLVQRGQSVAASFVIGTREVSFQFSAASLGNPLVMPALRQFACPSGL